MPACYVEAVFFQFSVAVTNPDTGWVAVSQALQSVATVFLETEDLPAALKPKIVAHMVKVHQSVRTFSTRFAEELRRHNYVTVSHSASIAAIPCLCIAK